jgi:hypothetical protein
LPHVWSPEGRVIQDRIPTTGFTLLRLNRRHDLAALRSAFEAHQVPLTELDIDAEPARAVYERDLLLLRPDLHVVWRGNEPPRDPMELAAVATGHHPGL